jgi:large subunit ribosomal protein L25
MADTVVLEAEPRAVLGKKVKRLRKEGVLPANIYGRGIESTAIQLDSREFHRVIRAHGARQMFRLAVSGEAEPRHVLIRAMERAGGTGLIVHTDFYQVELGREITTRVPVVLTGTAPAVKDLGGTLIHSLEFVNVRCLPTAIPDAFEVDVSRLASFDISIFVSDLAAPDGVTVEDAPELLVVTISPPRVITAEEAAEAAEAEAEAEAAAEAEAEAEAAGEAESA